MSADYINELLTNYVQSLKDYTAAVMRQASEEDVNALTGAVMDAAATFDDEMFERYGVTTPIEREWYDESEEPEDTPEPDEEVMVARLRFLSRGPFTDVVLQALDAHAQQWVTTAGDLGLEIGEFDVRVEPVDDSNWD